MLTNLPEGASELLVYGWDGLRRTIQIKGQQSLRIDNLESGETYMFLVRSKQASRQ